MPSFFFYLFATTTVLASLGVILARYPLYNVLSLVVVIFSVSSLFISLEAYFVGIILLLVYAGAVLVFFLFVVMCLNLTPKTLPGSDQGRFRLLGWTVSLALLSQILLGIKGFLSISYTETSTIRGTIETIGQILFTDYLLPFELTSFLLLIAIFGIVSLAKGAFSPNDKIEAGPPAGQAGSQ